MELIALETKDDAYINAEASCVLRANIFPFSLIVKKNQSANDRLI